MQEDRFTHIHASMRFDRKDRDLREQVVNLVTMSDLVTLTEVSAERREAVIKDVADEHGWGVLFGDKGGMDDTAILWKKERFLCDEAYTKKVSNVTVPGPGGGAPAASFAVLRDRISKKRLLVSVLHLMSGVEEGGRFARSSARVRAWRAAQKGWRLEWNRLAKQTLPQGVLICADWNVNIRTAFFRAQFKIIQPGMQLVLDWRNLPARGTLGKRIIDFSFIRGKLTVVAKPRILAEDESSDHKPYIESFGWKM